jgi:uncharacterized delta-60 repeat protein
MERQTTAAFDDVRAFAPRSRRVRIRDAAVRLSGSSVLAATPLIVFAPVAGATTAGGLDPSFGTGGRVVTNLGSNRYATGLAVQPDDKIIAVGGSDDLSVVRYNADGSLDPSFGPGGSVITNFGSADAARAVALQSEGKIVVVGTVGCCGTVSIVLARYNFDGSLDTTFDGDGKVVLANTGIENFGQAIAIQSDGKILVGGSLDGQLLVVRLESDGAFDSTFGMAAKRCHTQTRAIRARLLSCQTAGSLWERQEETSAAGLIQISRLPA